MKYKQLKPHVETLLNARRNLFQQKNDTGKIYSLHEPQVEYIAKDKAYYLRVCLNDPCRLNK